MEETFYTREQWEKDGTFAAKVGQEVSEEIYWEMFEVLPPYRLPQQERNNGYFSGFMVSEPHCHEKSEKTGEWLAHYAAFGKKDGKHYFLGYMNRYGEITREGNNNE